jgi:hypothetical protein
MIKMDNFFVELKEILEKVLIWSENFKKGDRDYDFDIDDELYTLSKKYNKDFKKGNLLLLYNLLDFYCDAVKHGFKKIDENYFISEAHMDIKHILNSIELSDYSKLEFSDELEKRLSGI